MLAMITRSSLRWCACTTLCRIFAPIATTGRMPSQCLSQRKRPAVIWSPPSSLVVGWWRTPNHSPPETLWLTEPTPHPMLGISGLLNLLTWVEHRQLAQASQHEEGGVPCPVPYPTRLPPTRFQASNQSVVGSAPGQSSAAPLPAESPARTPAGTAHPTSQAGQRRTQRECSVIPPPP